MSASIMRIYDWHRTEWLTVQEARSSGDLVLCRWENSRGDILKYRLAHPDDEHTYELINPNGEIVGRYENRSEVREASTQWLWENGRPGSRKYQEIEA